MEKALWDKSLLNLNDKSGNLNLFALAIPLFFQQVFTILLGTVNTVALTRVSEDAVTSVNVANMVIDIPVNLTYMITSGTLVILSLSLGAGKKDIIGKIYITGIISTAILSLILSVILFFSAPYLLATMNIENNVLKYGIMYFRIRILFLFFTSGTNCITAVLRAHGYANATMISGILTNVTNAIGSVFVVSRFFPGDKIIGVAIAAVLGQFIGFIYAFISLKRHSEIDQKGGFSPSLFKKIALVGIPGGMSLFAFSVSTAISTSVIASLGQVAVNTKVYTANISHYTYLFGYSIAQSGAIMIGRHVGGGNYDTAKKLFRQISLFVPVLNCLLALTVFLFATPLMKIFTEDLQIIAAAHGIFLLDIVIEIARGNTHVGENALGSVADTAFTSMVSILCCFCISSFGCWLFSIKLGMGLYGFYIASLLDESTRGILYRLRWNKSKWVISVKNKL